MSDHNNTSILMSTVLTNLMSKNFIFEPRKPQKKDPYKKTGYYRYYRANLKEKPKKTRDYRKTKQTKVAKNRELLSTSKGPLGKSHFRKTKKHGRGILQNADLFLKLGLREGRMGLKISHEEAAQERGISVSSQRRSIKEDILNGYIGTSPTDHYCKSKKVLWQGKNIIFLTQKGIEYLKNGKHVEFVTPNEREDNEKLRLEIIQKLKDMNIEIMKLKKTEHWKNIHVPKSTQKGVYGPKSEQPLLLLLGRKEYAKGKTPAYPSSSSKLGSLSTERIKLRTLQNLGFSEVLKELPLYLFEKAMIKRVIQAITLLQRKYEKHNYRVRNPVGWIINCVKDLSCGFRKHAARRLCREIHFDREEILKKSMHTGSHSIDPLVDLYYKYGLDISPQALAKVLRKGQSFAISAAKICIKKINYHGIEKMKNVNAYLNWLVGFKTLKDFFKFKKIELLHKR